MNIENTSNQFWHNGTFEIKPEEQNEIFFNPLSSGFSFTILTNGSEIIFFDNSISRILSLLKIYHFNSRLFSDGTGMILKTELKKLIIRNKYYKTARCIIIFSQNFSTGETEEFIFLDPDMYLFSIGKIMNKCFFSPQFPKPIGAVMNLPSVIYEFKKILRNEIIKRESDDCIIFNHDGSVVESFSGNIFFVEEMHIITPSLNTGCYPGIMRDEIISELKLMNFPVVEKDYITEKEVLNSKEIFTAGNDGIFSIKGIEEYRYFDEVRNLLIARIVKKYTHF